MNNDRGEYRLSPDEETRAWDQVDRLSVNPTQLLFSHCPRQISLTLCVVLVTSGKSSELSTQGLPRLISVFSHTARTVNGYQTFKLLCLLITFVPPLPMLKGDVDTPEWERGLHIWT